MGELLLHWCQNWRLLPSITLQSEIRKMISIKYIYVYIYIYICITFPCRGRLLKQPGQCHNVTVVPCTHQKLYAQCALPPHNLVMTRYQRCNPANSTFSSCRLARSAWPRHLSMLFVYPIHPHRNAVPYQSRVCSPAGTSSHASSQCSCRRLGSHHAREGLGMQRTTSSSAQGVKRENDIYVITKYSLNILYMGNFKIEPCLTTALPPKHSET